MTDTKELQALKAIDDLHREVDLLAGKLAEFHSSRMQCGRGCAGCCVDDLSVFEVEALLIVQNHPEVLRSEPHPAGACAFLDEEGACRVYASRPYVCRSQGLPLRWVDEDQGVEHRDICELNEPGGPPLISLRAGQCWTLGPAESKLQQIQHRLEPSMPRVGLRSLFVAQSAD